MIIHSILQKRWLLVILGVIPVAFLWFGLACLILFWCPIAQSFVEKSGLQQEAPILLVMGYSARWIIIISIVALQVILMLAFRKKPSGFWILLAGLLVFNYTLLVLAALDVVPFFVFRLTKF